MAIFENNALTIAFVISILTFVPYYWVLRREGLRIAEQHHVRLFFAIWLAAFTFEFYFLGPYSFVELTTEGNLNVTFNYYLTHGYDGGTFSHAYAGGQDLHTLLFGKHFFNPERLLIANFPIWIAILLHKVFIAAIGFIGAYLLARRVAPNNLAAATAIGIIFPVSHIYLLNFSTNWSPGFSALPLVVYWCVACSGEARYWPRVLLAAVLLTPADPIHVFPALAVAILSTVFLFEMINIKRIVLSFLFLVLCSLANWHEILYAFYQNVDLTTRIEGQSGFDLNFPEALRFGLGYGISRLKIPGVLVVLSLLVLAVKNDPYLKRALAAAAIWLAAFALAESLPWQLLGLGAVDQLSHYYMLLSLLVIFPPITARAFAALGAGSAILPGWPLRLKPEITLLAAALAILTWDKGVNFANFVWFGGQASLFAHETLKDNSWKPAEDFRAVTLLETPNANIVAGMYGIDTFDGQLNMYHAAWQDYWASIVRRDPTHGLTTRVGVKWKFWDGSVYDASAHIRSDLLGIANVRFLISGLPLKGRGLRPVVTPPTAEQAKMAWPKSFDGRIEFFKFRLRRVFDPGKHYVYELPQFLPRVFAATSVQTAAAGTNGPQLHERIAVIAPNRGIVVTKTDANKFEGLGTLKSIAHTKVTDGFDITVDAPKGGIAVVNTMYVPYWKAETLAGKSLMIAPANAVQVAIAVPAGTKGVKLRYRRPTVRGNIAQLLN